jgi:UrcA family protein
MMKRANMHSRLYLLIAGMVMLGTAAPSLAQLADEDIVVTGRYGPIPDSAQSLSQSVSYADLDLSTIADRQVLRHRLSLTSRYLCNKLGETDSSPGITPSCRDATYKDAINRVGTIEEHFAPRGTTWVASAAWTAPYPATWATTYP